MLGVIGGQDGMQTSIIAPNFLKKTINSRFEKTVYSVPRVVIERASNRTRVTIWTARPGLLSEERQEPDTLKDALNRTIKDIRQVQEIKSPTYRSLVAEKYITARAKGTFAMKSCSQQCLWVLKVLEYNVRVVWPELIS